MYSVRNIRKLHIILAIVFCIGSIPTFVYGSIPEYIKVGLKYGSTAVTTVTLTSDNGFQLTEESSAGLSDNLPISASKTIVATVQSGSIVLKDGSGTVVSAGVPSGTIIMPMDYTNEDSSVIYYDSKPYRGGIQLTTTGSSNMTVINYVELDDYLYGVLPAEMGPSFPIEALKAQAVTARSYVITNISAHSSEGFNVCTSIHCQVYSGVSSEYDITTKAVDETSGEVLYSNGNVVSGYYYKNSGGYTQNSEDVWYSPLSYLRAVEDIYSPDYSWSTTMTMTEIASTLKSNGKDVGTISSIGITGNNESGAVSEFTIIGSNGTIKLTKESVRTSLGGSNIKSTHFDVVAGTSTSSSTTTGYDSFYVSNGTVTSNKTGSYSVISSEGTVNTISGNFVAKGSASEKTYTSNESAEEMITSDTVTFVGKGYGHGVGMPQDSAKVMAEAGFDYIDILEFYYKGIKVK